MALGEEAMFFVLKHNPVMHQGVGAPMAPDDPKGGLTVRARSDVDAMLTRSISEATGSVATQ